MKFNVSFLIISTLLLTSLTIIGCGGDDDEMDPSGTSSIYDCTFVQDDNTDDGYIDDAEREIMQSCFADRITDHEILAEHLIGEWELVGHGEGWFPLISQPCSYITITSDEFIFEFTNASVDTISTHSWSTEKVVTPSFDYLRLNIEPNPPVWLGLSTFCDQYMYGDATPLDGNMYLYEKRN